MNSIIKKCENSKTYPVVMFITHDKTITQQIAQEKDEFIQTITNMSVESKRDAS